MNSWQRANAIARAELMRHLSPYERQRYRERGVVRVWGSEGGRYEITDRSIDNVRELVRTKRDSRHWKTDRLWCINTGRVSYCMDTGKVVFGSLPKADCMLAIKLLIEHDEPEFQCIAIPSRVPASPTWPPGQPVLTPTNLMIYDVS